MIAMRAQRQGTPRTANRTTELDQAESRRRKQESRARILEKIIPMGEISGTMQELREKLELEDMSMRLFRSGCKYLSSGDDIGYRLPRIIVRPVGNHDRGWHTNEPKLYRMRFLQ